MQDMRMRQMAYLTLLILSASMGVAAAASGATFTLDSGPRFLPVDEAFELEVSRVDDKVRVRWFIMPGYYLYRQTIAVQAQSGHLGEPSLPRGEARHDEYFGDVEVYHDELVVELPVIEAEGKMAVLVKYQGCAEAGYCYPPQKRLVNVENL